jgi:hypothetical protein
MVVQLRRILPAVQTAFLYDIHHVSDICRFHGDLQCDHPRTSKAKDISLQNPNFHARTVLDTFTSMTVLPSRSS